MRPATKVVPKALLTVVDRPAIQYAVEEAARAGATEAILIVDLEVGHLVHQHFVNDERLPGLEHIAVRPVVQEEPLGLGHAVLEAERMVAGRPFMCILADDIVRPGHDVLPALIDAAADGSSVVSIQEMTEDLIVTKGAVIPTSDLVDGVMSIGAGEAHILTLVVQEPSRGQGLGKMMIKQLLHTAEHHHVLAMNPPDGRTHYLTRFLL